MRVADGEPAPTLQLAVIDTTLLTLGDCETEGLANGDLLVTGDSESLPETLEDGETEGDGVSVRDVPGEELTICVRGGDREVEVDAVPTGERLTPLCDGHAVADELMRGERDAETLPVPEPDLVGELSGERVEAPVPVFGDPDGVIEVEGQTEEGGDGDAGPLCDAATDRESALRESVARADVVGTSDAELPELALVPTDALPLLLPSAENVDTSESLWPSENEATPTDTVGDTVDSIVSVADIEGERDCAFDTDAQAVDDAHQVEVGDDVAESPRLIEGVLLVDCEGSVDTVARGLSDVKLDGVGAPLALAPTIDSLEHKLVLATALCEEDIVADALTDNDALAEPDVDVDGVAEGERCRLPDARALPLDRPERLGDGDSDAPADAVGHAEGVRLADGVVLPVRLADVDEQDVSDALAIPLCEGDKDGRGEPVANAGDCVPNVDALIALAVRAKDGEAPLDEDGGSVSVALLPRDRVERSDAIPKVLGEGPDEVEVDKEGDRENKLDFEAEADIEGVDDTMLDFDAEADDDGDRDTMLDLDALIDVEAEGVARDSVERAEREVEGE